MKPIVIYSRVSTLDQNFESQIEDLIRWCKANNFKVVKTFGEKISGYDVEVERIEYESMKAYTIEHNIKDIAIWEISRLSRSMVKTVNEIDFFTKHQINIHFRKEGIESLSDNITNKLLITILSSMAQMERDTFIERGQRGKMSKVLKGKMTNYSTPPYGYIKDEDGMWSINEKEAKAIRLMYDMALKGTSLYKITQHLNSLKIPTRQAIQGKKSKLMNGKEVTTKWLPATVTRNLKKTLYKGEKHYKGHLIKIPAIVTPEIWEKVQNRFNDNIGYINRNNHPYLFKGMIRCGKCNRILCTQTHNKTNGYYTCSRVRGIDNDCDNKGLVNTPLIDNNLYSVLFNHTYIKEILSRDSTDALSLNEKQKQIDYFNIEIESLKLTIERYKNLYATQYMSFDEMVREINKVQNQITDLYNKISLLNTEISTLSQKDIDEIIKNYKDATDFKVKREFVTKYVNSITLHFVDLANVDWITPLQLNEKIIYIEILAFNYNAPIKILLTPYTRNVIVSKFLNYLLDYNMVVDINKKRTVALK